MRKFTVTVLIFILTSSFINFKVLSEEHTKDTQINIFTGLFDFSDNNLFRESFLGKISPITGGFLTENSAAYFYSGVQAEYEVGIFKITPSFAPGYYHDGNGKDLGSPIEFKSEVQLSFNLSKTSKFGMSYNHISNASLGDKNPGANSYMFNFLKQF